MTSIVAVLIAAIAVAGLGLAPAATAKKKKKKKKTNPAVTRVASVPFSAGTSVVASAACPKGTHPSGGGFAVAPNFNPGTTTGLRSVNSTSNLAGNGWTAGGSAYSTPAASGNFTTFARCEKNTLGGIAITGSSPATITPGAGQDLTFNCPPGTHVVSGGYAGPSLGAFTFAAASARIVVLGSRRTGAGQWTISAYNNSSSPAAATLTGYASCERNAKGRAVGQAQQLTPVIDNGRTSADATCAGKQHVISGGFLVSPAIFPGSVPFIGVDENQPTGKKSWHIALHEFPPFALPPGSSLETYAYCKKG